MEEFEGIDSEGHNAHASKCSWSCDAPEFFWLRVCVPVDEGIRKGGLEGFSLEFEGCLMSIGEQCEGERIYEGMNTENRHIMECYRGMKGLREYGQE